MMKPAKKQAQDIKKTSSKKRSYHSPTLTHYGNIANLVQSSMISGTDGGFVTDTGS